MTLSLRIAKNSNLAAGEEKTSGDEIDKSTCCVDDILEQSQGETFARRRAADDLYLFLQENRDVLDGLSLPISKNLLLGQTPDSRQQLGVCQNIGPNLPINDAESFARLIPSGEWEGWDGPRLRRLIRRLPPTVQREAARRSATAPRAAKARMGLLLSPQRSPHVPRRETTSAKVTASGAVAAIKAWLLHLAEHPFQEPLGEAAGVSGGSKAAAPMPTTATGNLDSELLRLLSKVEEQEQLLQQLHSCAPAAAASPNAPPPATAGVADQQDGGVARWTFRVRSMRLGMALGVAQAGAGGWLEPAATGRAWFWRSFGTHAYLGTGDRLVARAERAFQAGDDVVIELNRRSRAERGTRRTKIARRAALWCVISSLRILSRLWRTGQRGTSPLGCVLGRTGWVSPGCVQRVTPRHSDGQWSFPKARLR